MTHLRAQTHLPVKPLFGARGAMDTGKEKLRRFKEAAREAGTDMTKEEFARVIGGLAKPKPQPQAQLPTRIRKPKTHPDGIT